MQIKSILHVIQTVKIQVLVHSKQRYTTCPS